jgi:ADP-ribose pyrophosphatase YjhB (NUDIX family)
MRMLRAGRSFRRPAGLTEAVGVRISQKAAIGVVFVAAMFMSIMDATIVNVALPTIGRDFKVSPTAVDAISIAFAILVRALAARRPAHGVRLGCSHHGPFGKNSLGRTDGGATVRPTSGPHLSDNAVVADTAADMVRRIGIRLSALAQDGLTYATGDYDLDRYRQVSDLATELLAVISGRPAAELAVELGRDSGYATPKVDVRGAIFDDREHVLLMREKTDGRWSLPGGWADPGDAPSVAVTREILEETGYHSSAVKLIACWDRDRQGNLPPLPVHVYKLFFLCRRDGAVQPPSALETLEVGWFGLDELPPLSLGRVNRRQLERALAHYRDPSLPTEFD